MLFKHKPVLIPNRERESKELAGCVVELNKNLKNEKTQRDIMKCVILKSGGIRTIFFIVSLYRS